MHQGQVVDLTHEGQGVVKIDGYPFFEMRGDSGEQVHMSLQARLALAGRNPNAQLDRVEITDPIGRQIGTMTPNI